MSLSKSTRFKPIHFGTTIVENQNGWVCIGVRDIIEGNGKSIFWVPAYNTNHWRITGWLADAGDLRLFPRTNEIAALFDMDYDAFRTYLVKLLRLAGYNAHLEEP